MSLTEQKPETTAAEPKVKMKRSIIDCDLHLVPLRGGFNALKPYMPRFYREQLETWGPRVPAQIGMYNNGGTNGTKNDHKIPPGDETDALNYIRSKLLDKYNVEYGIITGMDYGINTIPDIDYAAAVTSACNDYTIEHVLDHMDYLVQLVGVDQATEQLLREAARHLRPGGELRLVANSFLKYAPLIEKHLGPCTVLAERDGFRVYSARRN